MKINIIWDKENEFTKIQAFEKELEVKKDSPTWNNTKINDFLIMCATKKSGDKIEVVYDKEINDPIHKHVVDLFEKFVENLENK